MDILVFPLPNEEKYCAVCLDLGASQLGNSPKVALERLIDRIPSLVRSLMPSNLPGMLSSGELRAEFEKQEAQESLSIGLGLTIKHSDQPPAEWRPEICPNCLSRKQWLGFEKRYVCPDCDKDEGRS